MEVERPAGRRVQGPGVGGGLGEPGSVFIVGRECGWGRESWRPQLTAHSYLSREPGGDGRGTMEGARPGPGGHTLLPDHCPAPAKGQGSQWCQLVPKALVGLQRI